MVVIVKSLGRNLNFNQLRICLFQFAMKEQKFRVSVAGNSTEVARNILVSRA
jgi:hypothetical protein